MYPYLDASNIPSKLTATGLKGRFADVEAAEEAESPDYAKKQRPPALRPNFIIERKQLTKAERGTALHLAMQYIDYEKSLTPEGVRGELKRLGEQNFLSAQQAEVVDPVKIASFFASPLGKARPARQKKLYREFKFSLLVPAETYYPVEGETPGVRALGDPSRVIGDPDWVSRGEILFQGVVDCCFEEGGALHVVDFKTDEVTPESLEAKNKSLCIAAYGLRQRYGTRYRPSGEEPEHLFLRLGRGGGNSRNIVNWVLHFYTIYAKILPAYLITPQ